MTSQHYGVSVDYAEQIAIESNANTRYSVSEADAAGATGPHGNIVFDVMDAPRINQDGVTIENYPGTIGTVYIDGERLCISSI
jgi:hypothetical protein